MRTLVKVAINAAAIWVAAALLEGMTLADGFTTNSTKLVTALVVGALFGVVNALARPLAKLLGLPFLILTLGLFIFVINAAMLMLTSWLAGQLGFAFHIDRFWPTAVVGAAIVSVVSWNTPPELRVLYPVAWSWMSSLSSGLPLTSLTIPGTHNTCSITGGAVPKCQDWDLPTQLGNGIRFLDIRLNGLAGTAHEMGLYHGPVYMYKRYQDVLSDCRSFLRNNPGEVIVMRIKNEYSGGNKLNAEEFKRRFNWHLDDPSMGFRPLFWTNPSWPTLGQARGKVVLLTDFTHDWATLRWGGNCDIQDQYNVSDDAKRRAIVAHFDRAFYDQSTSKMFINFTSTAKGPIPNPSIGAGKIFPSVYAYLDPRRYQRARFGIVPMDFPNYRTDILDLLINKNFI